MKFNSEIAKSIFQSKYMLKGIDKEFVDPLKRIDQVVTKYYPELKGKVIEYGTKKWVGFAGGLYRSAMNPNKNVSAVNCTGVYQPEDNLESISEMWYWWAKFSAYGQGEGGDLSKLRPRGALLHNSANTSTGVISFMHTLHGILKEIAQQGRRGASLVSLGVNHPDIEEFIASKDFDIELYKQDPEKYPRPLDTQNISVRAYNDFMGSVLSNSDYDLIFENEYETIHKKVNARDLFRQIAEQAWKTGDPGLLFWDTSRYYSNSDYLGYPVETVNACFAYDTPILTNEGYKPIGELDGQNVKLVNELGEVVEGKVWKNGEKEVVEVNFMGDSIESIICTPDHVFKTVEGLEVEAIDLTKKRVKPNIYLRKHNDNFVKLGFIQGDAGLTRLKSKRHKGFDIYFNNKDTEVLNLFGYKEEGLKGSSIYSTEFFDECNNLGFSSAKLPYRDLPSTFINWTLEEKLSFFRGLFSANGFVTKKHRVGLKSTNLNLIKQTMEFLDSVGIQSYITSHKAEQETFKNGIYTMKENYDLNIQNFKSTIKFAELIGFVQSYKNKDLEELINIKAPYVRSVKSLKDKQPVYDFQLTGNNHWGVINNVIAHNCSEQVLDGHNVCLLSSINLARFKEYGWEMFPKLVDFMTKLLDAFRREEIAMERSPSKEQLRKLIEMPRIGLGVTGLADLFIRQNIPYDYEEAINLSKELFGTMAGQAYKTSNWIAKEKDGKSFPAYDKEKYKQSPYVKRLLEEGWIEDSDLDYQAHVCNTTIAPNGCLVESSVVQTTEGEKTLKQIFAENLIDINELRASSKEWFVPKKEIKVRTVGGEQRLSKLYINGEADTLKVKTNTMEIEGTKDHKVLVLKEGKVFWVQLNELQKGDLVLKRL